MISLFDTHAHLTDKAFNDDLEKTVSGAQDSGVARILNVCDDVNNPGRFKELLEKSSFIYGAAGIHPHELENADLKKVPPMLELKKVVALGEIGLDYHYLRAGHEENEKKRQQEFFRAQLKMSKDAGLPVIIHCREAWDDTLKIVAEGNIGRGVFHCFSGGENELNKCLELGFYISFAGPITYPKAADLRKIVEITPLDRMLIETDCPYLAPQQHRGKRNEPAFIKHTAEKVAEIRKISLEEVSQITFRNACRIFNLVVKYI